MASIGAAISKLDGILSSLGVTDASAAPAPVTSDTQQSVAKPGPTPAPAAAAPAPAAPASTPEPLTPTPAPTPAPAPQTKESKPKAAAPAAAPADTAAPTPDVFKAAQFVVARVLSVDEVPDSEKLYRLQIDVGGGETRQVVSGIKQYVPRFSLLQQHVVVILNLKAAKLAGILSQAMILAAEGNGQVKLLVPPSESVEGDQVYLAGGSKPESYPKTLKSDKWRLIAGALVSAGGNATFAGTPMVTDKGNITVHEEIPDGSEIR